MKKEIILIGGGGHCRSSIEAIESENIYTIAGILDVSEKVGEDVFGYKIIGSDNDIPDLVKTHKNFIVTLGQIKSAARRKEIFNHLISYKAVLPVIKASTSVTSKFSSVREGTILMHGSILNAGASVGINCIINTGAVIEHDAIIGDHCHVSTGSLINGDCRIGDEVFVGSGSIIKEGIKIAPGVILGAGSVVINDIDELGIYAGNPLKRVS